MELSISDFCTSSISNRAHINYAQFPWFRKHAINIYYRMQTSTSNAKASIKIGIDSLFKHQNLLRIKQETNVFMYIDTNSGEKRVFLPKKCFNDEYSKSTGSISLIRPSNAYILIFLLQPIDIYSTHPSLISQRWHKSTYTTRLGR